MLHHLYHDDRVWLVHFDGTTSRRNNGDWNPPITADHQDINGAAWSVYPIAWLAVSSQNVTILGDYILRQMITHFIIIQPRPWLVAFVDRLQGIIADLESRLDKQAAEHAQSTVARDLELEALRQQEEKMRLEIVQIKENTDRLMLTGAIARVPFHVSWSTCFHFAVTYWSFQAPMNYQIKLS